MMRWASTGPIPGTRSNSSKVAVLILIGNGDCVGVLPWVVGEEGTSELVVSSVGVCVGAEAFVFEFLNALFRGTEVEKMISQQKHPFYSIRAKMMLGSVSEQFANLRHVKCCKSCVSDLNALFRGTEVEKMISQQKRPFYSIRAKMMFGSVSEESANLEHVKR